MGLRRKQYVERELWDGILFGEFTIETGKPVLLKEVEVIKDDLFTPIGESSGFLVNDRC
jgi:hypothetical protein